MKCPICKGKGCLPKPHQHKRDLTAERRKMAKTLRDAGYSLRQIRDCIGWKSVRSVTQTLEKANQSDGRRST